RISWRAGADPNRIPVRTERPAANATTVRSTRTSPSRRTPAGVDERLQPVDVRTAVLFVVDLDSHAQPRSDLRRVRPQQRAARGQRLIPRVDVRDPADRQHHPDIIPRGTPSSVWASVVLFRSRSGWTKLKITRFTEGRPSP